MKRAAHLALGLAVAALFLWLTLRHVDRVALATAARGLSLPVLALAPLPLALGYLCRILRWHRMLGVEGAAPGLVRTGIAFTASIAANNLAPLRAGDMLRAFGFSRWLGTHPGRLLATVLVERLLDLVVLILALALALPIFAREDAALGLAEGAGIALGATGLTALVLLLFPRLLAPPLALIEALAGTLGAGVRARIAGFTRPLLATLVTLSGRHAMPALIGWSLLVWGFEAATYRVIAAAMPALPRPDAAWLAMPVGTLSTLLPSTPGHVGTFDYFARAAALAAGNPLAEATAFALVAHVMLWLPTTLAGGVSLAIWALARPRAEAPK